MDRCLPGSSVHGIVQARILEWVAMPSSRGSSPPRDQTQVYYISLHSQGRFFTMGATRRAQKNTVDLKSTVKPIQHNQDQMHLLVGGNFLQRQLPGGKLGGPACSKSDFSIMAPCLPTQKPWTSFMAWLLALLFKTGFHAAPLAFLSLGNTHQARSACQDCPSQAREDGAFSKLFLPPQDGL